MAEQYLYQFKNLQKECDAFAQILSNPKLQNQKVRVFCDLELYKNYLTFVMKRYKVDYSIYAPQIKPDLYKLAWLDVLENGITPQRLLKISNLDKIEILSYSKNEINEKIERELEYINNVISHTTFIDKKTPDEIRQVFAPFQFLGVDTLQFEGLYNSKEFFAMYKKVLLSQKESSFNPNAHVQIFDYKELMYDPSYSMNILLGLVQYEYFDGVDMNSFIVLNNPHFSYYLEINNVATDIIPVIDSLNLTLIPERKISSFSFQNNVYNNLNINNLDLKATLNGKLSVTRIQDYDSCPFRFWSNTLDKTRFPLKDTPAQIGSACHHLIYSVLSRIINGQETININEDRITEIFNEEIQTKTFQDFLLSNQNTSLALLKSMETLKLTLAQLRESKFELYASEMKVGENIGLNIKNPILGDILITGIIDRIDKYEEDGVIYFNVVDYKSGSMSFPNSELQLELYASSLKNIPGNVQISGMLLHKISAPIDDIDKNYETKNKMIGVSLDKTILAMAPELAEPSASANYISAYTKKDGGLSKSSQVKTAEEIEDLISKGVSKAESVIGRIASGQANAIENSMCAKCPYSFICK